MDRLPPLPEACWNEAQRGYAREIIDGPRGALLSPFVPLMRSPELMAHASRMGEYLRYRSALPPRLSELAILVTAHQWGQAVEWAIHAPIAARAGVTDSTIQAIAAGISPEGLPADEASVYALSMELHQQHGVSDPTWQAAIGLLGERGVVDLIGINGYYTFLSMVMNAARTPVPGMKATES